MTTGRVTFISITVGGLWCLLSAFGLPLSADERLKGIACRSVHLSYGESDKLAFYNEVTVRQSAPSDISRNLTMPKNCRASGVEMSCS